jgi:hypothetical protein
MLLLGHAPCFVNKYQTMLKKLAGENALADLPGGKRFYDASCPVPDRWG